MSQENSASNKGSESDSAFGHFLDDFNLNRNFNIDFGNMVARLNAKLADKAIAISQKFEKKLTAGKKYPVEAKSRAIRRFKQMLLVIEPTNDKDKKDVSFNNGDIGKIFSEFVQNRNKIESAENINAEDRNKLVDDVLNSNYKILAIHYFAEMLSAKDLDYFLGKLESMQNVLSKNTDPGWFEKFCLMAKTFFESLINRNVKRINLNVAGFKLSNDENRRKKIVNSRYESVFDKLKRATVEIGTQNWNPNKVKETNEIEKN